MSKKSFLISFVMVFAFAFITSMLFAREEADRPNKTEAPALSGSPRSTLLNINSMAHWLRADGWSARDPRTGNSGVVFPRGISNSLAVIFQDGMIWGGMVDDGQSPELRVGGQTYNIGTLEGAITSPGVAESTDAPDVRIYRIRRDYAIADLSLDAQELSLSQSAVREQYRKDWEEWPWEKGAPWTGIDNQLDGGYLGADGETVVGAGNGVLDRGEDANSNGVLDEGEDANGNGELDGEFPGVAGADMVVWTVANDLAAAEGLYGSPPIGLEMQLTAWGYNRTGALGNMIFKQVKVIYKGTEETPGDASIDPMYYCQWSDPDLGTYSDDFVGVDRDLSLMFVYNSSSVDNTYNSFGFPPPAAGYDFFQGALVPGDPDDVAIFNLQPRPGFRNLPASSFSFFAAGSPITDPPLGDYQGTREWWNLLRGFQPQGDINDPNPYTNSVTGEPTKFPLGGDPVAGEGDIDGNVLSPGDRRMLIVTGPFQMAVGDTQEVVISLLAALGSDRLSSVSALKFFDVTAQLAFDNLFAVPSPAPGPDVRATGLDGEILLNWGQNAAAVKATEDFTDPNFGFRFEGYNVYQLASASPDLSSDNAIRLATFDRVNEVTTIISPRFDSQSGVILDVPVQQGRNTGITRSFRVTEDRFRDLPIANDRDYFFAVTAYTFTEDEDQPDRSLESPPNVVTVRAQKSNPGVNLPDFSFADALPVDHEGTADGTVIPEVVDPKAFIDATYQLSFNQDTTVVIDTTVTDTSTIIDTSLVIETNFDVINTATGESVYPEPQTNLSVDEDYLSFNGVRLRAGNITFEPPITFFDAEQTVDADPSDAGLALWGDSQLFGAPTGFYQEFSGLPRSNDPGLLQRDLELRFTGETDDGTVQGVVVEGGSYATQWERAAFGAADLTGLASVGARIPFELWDVENDRQINMAFVNRNADDAAPYGNGIGDPNVPGMEPRWRITGRDYIIPIWTDYDEQAAMNGEIEWVSNPLDATWMLFFHDNGVDEWTTGDEYFITYANPVQERVDKWFFSTSAAQFSASQQRAEALEQVGVFPNPYLGVNQLERSSSQRFVRFNHLPPNSTIRIFNLAGTLVETLEGEEFQFDDQEGEFTQYIDWDLQNTAGLPVASGIYLAHVEMPDVGEKVLKVIVIQEEQFLDTF